MSIDGARHILATSGGFTRDDRDNLVPAALVRYALELTGKARPRLCFLDTAGGDSEATRWRTYAAFAGSDVEVSHLQLFTMPNVDEPREHLLAQDLIWVWGGSTANLLAVWQVHGLDDVLRTAWEAGVVLAGVSAGSLCWHRGGTTDSFGPQLRPVTGGLGLVPYSNCPHYDSEERRRPTYHQLVASGMLPAGYATDDGVGLHYVGTEMVEAVSEQADKAAYFVEAGADGAAVETRIEPRMLG